MGIGETHESRGRLFLAASGSQLNSSWGQGPAFVLTERSRSCVSPTTGKHGRGALSFPAKDTVA